MTLKEQIREDMKTAMREHNKIAVTTYRSILSAFTNELVAQKRKPTDELSDEDALKVIKRAVKQRKDAIEQFEKGGRDDLAKKEKEELALIEKYLPAQASKEEIEKVVRAKIDELGITDKSQMGQLMGAVMKEFAGNADGNDVKEVVNNLL